MSSSSRLRDVAAAAAAASGVEKDAISDESTGDVVAVGRSKRDGRSLLRDGWAPCVELGAETLSGVGGCSASRFA